MADELELKVHAKTGEVGIGIVGRPGVIVRYDSMLSVYIQILHLMADTCQFLSEEDMDRAEVMVDRMLAREEVNPEAEEIIAKKRSRLS